MRRILAILLSVIFVISFTACSANKDNKNEQDNSKAGTNTSTQAEAPKGKTKVRLAYGNGNVQWPAGVNENNNFAIKWLSEKSGVDIEVVLLPNEDPDAKINMLAAVGDVPDIIRFGNQSNFFKFVKEGTIKSIDDKVKNYSNLQKTVPEKGWDSVKYEGKICGVPSMFGSYGPNLPFFRKDWLDNLGLKVPNTLDEYFEVAKAFTEKDPDKDGKANTAGFTFPNTMNGLDVFFGAYGVPREYDMKGIWDEKDGQLSYSGIWEENKEVLAWFQKLYTSGYLDKEFLTSTSNIYREKISNGTAGLSAANPKEVYNIKTPTEKLNPKALIEVHDNLTKPSVPGKSPKYGTPYYVSGYVGITKNIDASLKVLDALGSAEAMQNIWAGPEGMTWKKTKNYEGKDAMEWLQPASNENAFRWTMYWVVGVHAENWYAMPPYNVAKEAEWRFKRVYDVSIAQLADAKVPYIMTKFVSEPTPAMIANGKQLLDLERNAIMQIISGAKPVSEYDNFIKEWKTRGGDKITQEINEIYKKSKK